MKIAFVVGEFPVVSETFIINQIADLEERGTKVETFYFKRGKLKNISRRYFEKRMDAKASSLEMPNKFFKRLFLAIPKFFHIFFFRPSLILKIFNFKKYGRNAFSLKLLFWTEPFLGKEFDLVHCHFGPIANKFLIIKEILGLNVKMVTTFYGYDVSHIFAVKPVDYYDRLKKECSLFFVMSNNMKKRIVARGFDGSRVEVLPVSIDVVSYPYQERNKGADEPLKIISVGRFTEKKGFDDLLRALAILKKRGNDFECHLVGGGELEDELKKMTHDLGIEGEVKYEGYMPVEEVINYFLKMHLFVQPSKTAKDGDME